MAAKDIYHEPCVNALKKDGWVITNDPLTIAVEDTNLLIEEEQDRTLFLAIRKSVYDDVFVKGVGKLFINSRSLRLVVFDPDKEKIVQWIR